MLLPQLHMLFARAADGATQSGRRVLGSGERGEGDSSIIPRGHPVQMGNRNDLEGGEGEGGQGRGRRRSPL